jgi:hypothetical protein
VGASPSSPRNIKRIAAFLREGGHPMAGRRHRSS